MASVVASSALVDSRSFGLRLWRLGLAGWAAVRFGPRRALPLWCGSCGGVLVLVAVRRLGSRSCFAVACAGPRGCGSGCFLSRLPGGGPEEPEPEHVASLPADWVPPYEAELAAERQALDDELAEREQEPERYGSESPEVFEQRTTAVRSALADLSVDELMKGVAKLETEKWRHLHETHAITQASGPRAVEGLMRTRDREFRKIAKVPRYLLWC